MADRSTQLRSLNGGDIFHAECPNGASLICLVLSVDDSTIRARRVTTQEHLEFDRTTGATNDGDRRTPCVINSIAPVPPQIHEVLLGMDRKSGSERDPERLKLTEDEKKALVFVGTHYPANLL